jgi:hypothetical protein
VWCYGLIVLAVVALIGGLTEYHAAEAGQFLVIAGWALIAYATVGPMALVRLPVVRR